jgi:hypothetical protein
MARTSRKPRAASNVAFFSSSAGAKLKRDALKSKSLAFCSLVRYSLVILNSTIRVTYSSHTEKIETLILTRFLRQLIISGYETRASDRSLPPIVQLINQQKGASLVFSLLMERVLARSRVPSVASHDPTCASPAIDAEDRHPMGRRSRCRFQTRCSCLQDLRGGEATSPASVHSLEAGLVAAGREAVPVPQLESTARCH